MSNTATTALLVPIGLSINGNKNEAESRAVLMAMVIGGSCAYATPIGMPSKYHGFWSWWINLICKSRITFSFPYQ